jgi:CheY-like chemotaxis protein
VKVSVRDTGIGIAREFQSRVFDLFTRVHPDEAIKTSGLGIGLALARRLVEQHRGRLELHSEGPGAGSEFIVSLPLAVTTRTDTATDAAHLTNPSANGRRVLVVDDNKDAAASLSMLLQIDGCNVAVAENGADALSAYDRFRPEVVLLDIGLPDIDGYEVARQLRTRTAGAGTLIIALTGWGQAQDKQRALQAGFDEHLTKPVEPEVLRMLMAIEQHPATG